MCGREMMCVTDSKEAETSEIPILHERSLTVRCGFWQLFKSELVMT